MNGIRLFVFLCFCSLNSFAKELAIESFSQLPSHARPSLSPSGNKIAFIKNHLSPELTLLTSFDLVTGKQLHLVKSDNEKIKIKWFRWANEKTIIVSVRYTSTQGRTDYTETRLLAVDIDGDSSVQRQIAKPKRSQRSSQFQDTVVSFLPDDPEHILVALDLDKANLPSVYKVNIYSDKKSRVVRGRSMIRSWMADRQGKVRLGKRLDYAHGAAGIKVQIGDDDTWHDMFEYNALEEPAITPLGFAKDPNILYYNQYKGDKKALYKINLVTKESTLVFEDEDYDVDGSLIYSRKSNDVIGVYHSNSADGRVYWDESRKKFQQSLNKALPDKDVYLVDFNQDESIYLLYTENDYTPGVYYFGNRNKNSLVPVLDQYPELVPEVLTEHKFITYTARDGTELEGYLTLPLGADGPVPTILHPHGGPGAREYDGFDYWTSFFANRGYAVFRPNFRGSTGYGYEFTQSQMQGWGLTMQDDLTDAANWLVEQNIAVKDKMCIVGASYGGYAAAMAAVKTPDLFKCAVSFAGVTDLKELVSTSRRYLNSNFAKKQLGSDSEDLKARSPAYHANKVKIPMLFIHGEDDVVVAVEQSKTMVNALQSLDKEVEFIELENGDHYLSIQRNRHTTFKAMDAFLKKHLN
ncbi:alpha/beta hydrolase family protein [Paraglaciecola sp. 2405UD69-4]|uniref:alpha/beta hydrolase family protein n=1 Tax=Paraglaciecola sp. 2405UD69-4 TaxID=3391836 RepID=UPI0039C8E5AB